jgi:hypothetical protein
MSEFQPQRFENHGEHTLTERAGETAAEVERQTYEQAVEAPRQDISEIRADVQENAAESAPVSFGAQAASGPTVSPTPNKELKVLTAQRALSHIRHNLSGSDKALSKVIHRPAVRVASDVTARTVGRPIALLVGGLFALVGSGLYLYLAKHIGFEYNYLISTMLFTAGLVVGLLLEGAASLITRGKKPHHL